MHDRGLNKLKEECGELIQVAAKQADRIDMDYDRKGRNLKRWLEEEMGDVIAAARIVAENFGLDNDRIAYRIAVKYEEFKRE